MFSSQLPRGGAQSPGAKRVDLQFACRRCDMNFWVWVLMAILIFAPKGATPKAGRWDWRALALLLCVIAVMTQI